MSLTPNYSFIIPTGSDAVNLLTQCYPNFTSLDSILKPIQESGVTVATDTKVGTVHQLVRTDSSCNMFRFVATGNYVSGDTFTVDGTPVTATAMDGTSLPGGAFVINQSVVCVLNNLVLTVLIAGKEVSSLPASSITYDNTVSGLTATNAQNAIDEIVSDMTATNIEYDNNVSGLTATDVQSAIDEIANSGGADHGLFELWANPNPLSAYAGGTITINGFDTSRYDALEIEKTLDVSETFCAGIARIESAKLSSTPTTFYLTDTTLLTGTGKILYFSRSFTASLVGTTLTITFSNGMLYSLASYGVSPSGSTDNSREVPLRILGLVHNS